MKTICTKAILVALIVAGVSSCEWHTPKFNAGDRVVRKLTGREGVVWLRVRASSDDVYFLRVRDQQDEITDSQYNAFVTGKPRDWHLDGPYHEDDLLPAPK
jgi:hypothetical protein